MLRRWGGVAIVVGTALLVSSEAQAACTISTTNVAFGSYNVFDATPTDTTGGITIKCSILEALLVNITVSLSQGASGTYSPRTMRRGSEPLPYNLFLDANRTSIWGNGSGGTSQYTAPRGLWTTQNATIYARIPAGADVSPGTYTDTVVATVNF